MSGYLVEMTRDELAVIQCDGKAIGRALTRTDGIAICAELNRLTAGQNTELRERILAEVTDAVENCFEEAT